MTIIFSYSYEGFELQQPWSSSSCDTKRIGSKPSKTCRMIQRHGHALEI